MKATIAALGIVVLIAGVGILAYGLSAPLTSSSASTSTATGAVVGDTNRVVSANGFWAMGAANLNQGEPVTGTVSISNYSAAMGPIFVYVQNESNFIAWGACAPCGVSNVLNQTLPSSGSYTLSFTAPSKGSFYFVLDNSYYGDASPATFSANGQTVQITQLSITSGNTNLNYGGAAIAVIGSVILGAGIVMGTHPTKKPAT
jgi:hypothetical protein